MEKRYSTPAKEIMKIQSGSRFSRNAISAILRLLKIYFKSEILVEIPPGLQNYDLEMISLIKLASQAQAYWNFSIKKIENPAKEPFLFFYRATSGNQLLSASGDFFSEKAAFENCLLEAIAKSLAKNRTNVSSGKSLEEAKAEKILEIISQKAFQKALERQECLQKINLDHLIGQDEKITKIIRRFKVYNLEIMLYALSSDFSPYSILAVILDKKNKNSEISFGLSSALDLRTAIIKSISSVQAKRTAWKENGPGRSEGEALGKMKEIIGMDIEYIDANLFENQNFFETLKDKHGTSEEYWTKVFKSLASESNKLGIKINSKEIKSKKLKRLGLSGVKIELSKY
jgi:ribosomal protein S12 methylthiotransferase accessory factor YcaO